MNEPLRVVLAEPDGYNPAAQRILDSIGPVTRGPFNRAELLAAVADAQVLIVRLGHSIDAELLERAPRLRVIVSATTGLDHIDTVRAAERDVAVLSLSGEVEFLRSIRATVEHTLALALAVLRRVPAAAAHVEAGGWNRDPFRGGELSSRRLGVVGCGRIGEAVADLARAFQMDVSAFDPYKEPWPDGVNRAHSLEKLAAESDVLSVHTPLNDETRGMIGASVFAALPPGAVLVNTARGGIVDEAAMLAALRSGALAGAGLDVLDDEPGLRAGRPNAVVAFARERDTVVITPHIGGATFESMLRTEAFMAERLVDWLNEQS